MSDTFSIGKYIPIPMRDSSKVDSSDREFKRAFDFLREAIETNANDVLVSCLPDSIWIHGGDIWLRITRKGIVEFGEPCA